MKMKKILSAVLASAMVLSLVSVQTTAQAAPAVSSVAYIGDASSNAGWQAQLTSDLGAEAAYTAAESMRDAMLNLPQIKQANPDMVVIDASIAGAGEEKFFESVLLTIQSFDKTPYVAIVSESSNEASFNYTESLAVNFDVDWICLEDLGEADSVMNELTYKPIGAPKPGKKLSSYSSVVDPELKYSGTITDETKKIMVYGEYVMIKTGAASGKYSVKINNINSSSDIASSDGVTFYKDRLGKVNWSEVVITATGTVDILGVYSDAVPETDVIKLGFEDNDITVLRPYDANMSWESNVDGDAAVRTKKTRNTGDVDVAVKLNFGVEYKISAKVKPISDFTDIMIHKKQLRTDAEGYLTTGSGFASTAVKVTPGEWTEISTTFIPEQKVYVGGGKYAEDGTEYCQIAFRGGPGDNSNTDAEFYIDDIVIEKVIPSEKLYSFDIDFENKSAAPGYLNTGDKVTASYVEGAGEDGGTVVQFTGPSSEMVRVNDFYLTPNRYYTISYKIRGISDNSVGLYPLLFAERAGKLKRSNGDDASIYPNTGNYPCLSGAQISKEWQTVTYTYHPTAEYSDYEGRTNMYFRLCTANSAGAYFNDSAIIQLDDFKVIPEDLIYGGDFEGNVSPDNKRYAAQVAFESITGMDGNPTKALKWGFNTDASELYWYLACRPGKKYRFSFDYKAAEGNSFTVSPILHYATSKIKDANGETIPYTGKGFIYLTNAKTAEAEWQTLTAEFVYEDAYGFVVSPSLWLRAGTKDAANKEGAVYLDNLKLVEVPYIDNINAAELSFGKRTAVTFADNIGGNMGYIYKVYSDDAIYASGYTKSPAFSFNNYAAYGKKLYADIQYIDSEGNISAPCTGELGLVTGGDVKFSAEAGFATTVNDFYDGKVIGKALIQNDENTKTVMLGIAVYEIDDAGNEIRILSFDTTDCNLAPYEEKSFTVEPKAIDADKNLSAKVFVWDSLTGLTPCCSASKMNNL
ncbi:MAG: hypothetical protein J6N52_04125 [Clostridia bacterium]|nr:hypothetical protein [Clostridia bacterium]